jgi:uncharacterized protein YneF (UPF0154 family)
MAAKSTKKQQIQVLSLLAGFAAGYLAYNRYLSQKLIKQLRNNPE